MELRKSQKHDIINSKDKEEKMQNTTLCYIERDEKYLMLLRNKKETDANKNKWIGIGGKFEEGESPDECLLREVKEETGLTLKDYRFRGIVTFVSDKWGTEYMHLYTASDFTGTIQECMEGELQWIPVKDVMKLNLWEGDRIFLKLLAEDSPVFSLTLTYQGDVLKDSSLKVFRK